MLPAFLVMVIAIAVVLAIAARRTRKPPPTATDAPPTRPVPGHATFSMRGAVTLTVDGAGTSCLGGGFQVGSAELAGPEARPAWTFVAYEQSPGTWQVALSLRPDDPEALVPLYSWTGAPGGRELTVTATAISFALTLTGGDGTVEATGELRGPVIPEAPVPRTITAILARHAGAPVRPYSTFDFGRSQHPGAASAIVSGDDAEARLRRVRRALPPGWLAYLGTSRFLGDERPPEGAVELVVAPGVGPLDIVRTARTEAVNHDLLNEGIVRALDGWDRAWGIDVVHADADTIELVLARLPDDVAAFADDVYALCPDVVDQGSGSVEELATEITTRRRVHLWWD